MELGAFACYLSGAGPTLMAIVDNDNFNFVNNFKIFMEEQNIDWNIKELKIDKNGAQILKY